MVQSWYFQFIVARLGLVLGSLGKGSGDRHSSPFLHLLSKLVVRRKSVQTI
jgi:hypothetical protein